MVKIIQSPGYVFDEIIVQKEKNSILARMYIKDPIDRSTRLQTTKLQILAYYAQKDEPYPTAFIVDFPFKLHKSRFKNCQYIRMQYPNSSITDYGCVIPENNGTITIIKEPYWFIAKDTETLMSTIVFSIQTFYLSILSDQPKYTFAKSNFIQQAGRIIYAEYIKNMFPLQFENAEELIYEFPETETYKTMREKMEELAQNKKLIREKLNRMIDESAFTEITCSIPDIPPLYTITRKKIEKQINNNVLTIQTKAGNFIVPSNFTSFFTLLTEIIKDSGRSDFDIKYAIRNYTEELLERNAFPLIKIKNLSAG